MMSQKIDAAVVHEEGQDIYENPMQTDGFEFVEFSCPDDGTYLKGLFNKLGFTAVAKHKSKNILLYRQNEINILLNLEPNSSGANFAKIHGSGACSMGFRVKDAKLAYKKALYLGATPSEYPTTFNIPAINGIGESLIYFVDQYTNDTIYDKDFLPLEEVDQQPKGHGLLEIDHLTHNVFQGKMDHWAHFYRHLFNFRQIRYFHITGEQTGLLSRALISPCDKIRIPINEATEEKSQIAEFLKDFSGEGIQHIAFSTNNIEKSVPLLQNSGIDFMKIGEGYYNDLRKRLPGLKLNWQILEKHHILIDGEIDGDKKSLLYQIFTKTVIGPIFFEIIQRAGHGGFGEGNFSALFKSLELDQKRRGVL